LLTIIVGKDWRSEIICQWKNHLGPFFELLDITQVELEWGRYVRLEKEQNPNRKLYHDWTVMNRILSHAVLLKALAYKPRIKISKADHNSDLAELYEPEEIQSLIKSLKRTGSHHAWLVFLLAISTGMRRGEILKLQKSQVDLKKQTIYLKVQQTKMDTARAVIIDEDIAKSLRRHMRRFKLSPWVFPQRHDQSKHATRGIDRTWQRVKKQLKIDKHFHWTRHTNASASIAAGIPERVVCATKGMSTRILDQVYHRANINAFREQSLRVREALGY
jgi:integrase